METFEDIIKGMREKIETSDGSASAVTSLMSAFVDRLEAAYKRDIKAIVDANEAAMKTAMDEVTRLREENERLKEDISCVLRCGGSTCGCMIECRDCSVTSYIGGKK